MTARTIRAAVVADLDRLVALEEACEGRSAWSPALIAEGVAGLLPTTRWLVAERVDGAVDGYAVLSLVDDMAELQRIGVDPGARRQGIGAVLLGDVIDRSRRGGAVRLFLEVREDNEPAFTMYAGAGFSEIGRRRRYYADGTTAVVMELVLQEDGRRTDRDEQ